MMNLEIQILTLLFSFFYGIFFSVMVSLNYKFIYGDKRFLQIIFTLIFMIVMIMFYFLGLKIVNRVILHPYEFVMIIFGFFVEHYVRKKFALLFKR